MRSTPDERAAPLAAVQIPLSLLMEVWLLPVSTGLPNAELRDWRHSLR